MSDSREDLKQVAGLARLELNEEESTELGAQIDRILGYVRALAEVDVSGVAPTKHVLDLVDVVRADREAESLPRERVLEQAPDHDEGHFVVPGVMPE